MALLLILPFLPLEVFPILLLLLAISEEKKKEDYGKHLTLSLILAIFPSLVKGISFFPYYFSYAFSLLIILGIVNRNRELFLYYFPKNIREEIEEGFFFIEVIKEKVRAKYILVRLRKSFNISGFINLLLFIERKAKRRAITKAFRESLGNLK